MGDVVMVCGGCNKQIEIAECTVAPACECGSKMWTLTEFRISQVHMHDWHRNGATQVVCFVCGAREERPPAPDLPPIGSRWRFPNGRLYELEAANAGQWYLRNADGERDEDGSRGHWRHSGNMDGAVRVESCVEGLPAIRIDGIGLQGGGTVTVDVSSAVPRTRYRVDADECTEQEYDDHVRAACKALVDAAVLTPPPGVNQRAWRAALMALEEHWLVENEEPIDAYEIECARVLLERYERGRGR
jgi:hypothetical protein